MSAPGSAIHAALSACDAGTLLRVKVVPNASRSRLAGMLDRRLKVQLAAPPEAGKANKALCELLAKQLGVRTGQVAVTAGHTQPTKSLTIATLDPDQVAQRLGPQT